MTPRQESNVERTLGRLEAQFESIAEIISRVDERGAIRDSKIESIVDRLGIVEHHAAEAAKAAARTAAVEKSVADLQQTLRDGKMTGRGIMMGIALSAGAGGAAAATVFKSVWTWFTAT